MNPNQARLDRVREVNARLWAAREANRPTGKVCTKCHEDKPFEEFPPNRKISTGRSSWCRECHNEASRRWRKSLKTA